MFVKIDDKLGYVRPQIASLLFISLLCTQLMSVWDTFDEICRHGNGESFDFDGKPTDPCKERASIEIEAKLNGCWTRK